jgi:hypothetical protein
MKESFEPLGKEFIAPDFFEEYGEFERVAKTFDFDISVLLHVSEVEGKSVSLSEDIWAQLENSDSYKIEFDDWDRVRINSEAQEVTRDWKVLRDSKKIKMPIIMKYASTYHLVSGNTRLMVCRAMGIRPEVFIFEIYEN